MRELAELLDEIVVPNEYYVIAGDVNIHVETEDLYARRFHELLNLHDIKQHVNELTHSKGHTLDVVLTSKNEDLQGITVTELDLSDHYLIDFEVKVVRMLKRKKIIKYRLVKTVDNEKFCRDVIEKLEVLPASNNVGIKDTNEQGIERIKKCM